ncbi:uncharacterized protein RHTO_05771 [Rhodotorula toruloides NP11]|uniref:Proteophosphoglycan ppg4 n=1 Tax=Rhodotorula toruloides (strain NP11) TaxID=1130832 RepID=M7XEX9_RHOT1|nr:uncharacterized protein RHTO_05771 [Rhodotorula toruloides NP11]EMS18668.1 hypothetical protein RHTO_05771 [Rhodotorula toruloides NP11]
MFSAHRDDRQVEAPPSPPAVDRLSKLPMELLQKIFDDAYATDKPTEPLSRTLLPLFDRCVWRDVKVVGDKRLVAFCATFQTRPSVGRHCRTLKVEHLRSPAVVSQASLETVFANVPILVTLVIHGDWDTLLEVLMPSGRQAALPFSATIRHYSCICKTQRTDPYNPAYLACITSMTGLTALQLVLEHTEQGSAVSPPLPSNGSVKVAPLNVLSISVLRESDLDTPDRLEHLVLHAFAVARRALPAELKQLTHLKQFTFHGDFSQLGRDSFDILRALPLERIELGRKSDISSVELIALLTGETRLPSLKRLHLDNLEGVIGGSIATESDIDEDGADRGWIMPRWTRSFRKMDRHGLINAGVKITGSFLRASDTEDAWNDALDTFADNENELFWLAMEANDGDEVAAWEAVYSGRMF